MRFLLPLIVSLALAEGARIGSQLQVQYTQYRNSPGPGVDIKARAACDRRCTPT